MCALCLRGTSSVRGLSQEELWAVVLFPVPFKGQPSLLEGRETGPKSWRLVVQLSAWHRGLATYLQLGFSSVFAEGGPMLLIK